MKILHVVPSFVPCLAAGGVVNASYQIAKKQKALGHDVVVYTTDSCIKRLEFEDNYNVDVEGGKKVEDRFRYASDNNTEWLSVEELREALKDID